MCINIPGFFLILEFPLQHLPVFLVCQRAGTSPGNAHVTAPRSKLPVPPLERHSQLSLAEDKCTAEIVVTRLLSLLFMCFASSFAGWRVTVEPALKAEQCFVETSAWAGGK